jgi:hypothetical protein
VRTLTHTDVNTQYRLWRSAAIDPVAVQAFEGAVGAGSFFELRQVEKNLIVHRI